MSVLDWLRQRPDGLQGIDDEMQRLIVDFSLLWMYFEANYLGADGSPDVLMQLAKKLDTPELQDWAGIEHPFKYFQTRYLTDGKPSSHFGDLQLAKKWQEIVENGLLAPTSFRQQLEVCLLIMNRYRNNLFHGPKWLARFEGDRDNLAHAIDLVIGIIHMHDRGQIQ